MKIKLTKSVPAEVLFQLTGVTKNITSNTDSFYVTINNCDRPIVLDVLQEASIPVIVVHEHNTDHWLTSSDKCNFFRS